ncbi:hypothetical protein GJ744_003355 [Endocarpon pusillum]|uniref:Uncharacterized protein n=1 Tax=Endocarpon pusillum TaxID=364733 RepID=A0A8H7DY38_9EURO|nr:hypothetical protein GJ744_003355 [Endocarpon pusillum]
MTKRTNKDLLVDDSEHIQLESIYDDILRVASSGGEKQRAKTVVERERTPGATGATQKKNAGGAAANIYKEIRDITKSGNAMI